MNFRTPIWIWLTSFLLTTFFSFGLQFIYLTSKKATAFEENEKAKAALLQVKAHDELNKKMKKKIALDEKIEVAIQNVIRDAALDTKIQLHLLNLLANNKNGTLISLKSEKKTPFDPYLVSIEHSSNVTPFHLTKTIERSPYVMVINNMKQMSDSKKSYLFDLYLATPPPLPINNYTIGRGMKKKE